MFCRPLRLAVTYGTLPLLLLFRYLRKLVVFLGVGPFLTLLWVLYTIAEYVHTQWYFVLSYAVWKPGFPLSWRIALVALFAVPTCSCLHFLSLAWQHAALVRRRSKSSTHPGPFQGYTMLPRSATDSPSGGEYGDPEWGAGAQRPRSPPPQQTSGLVRLAIWFAISSVCLWLALHYQHPGDVRYLPLINEANAHPKREGYANREKIFIGAMFYNNELVIPYWSDSIVKAIHYLGTDNVFVSIVESRSGDRSPALLRELDERLGAMRVQRRILTQDEAIVRPDDMGGKDRIGYLAALRNRVLEPLVETGGYDRVLFSNDIFVEPESIVELLKTADGEYDMACGMDYLHFGLYDMWVLRDKLGRLASGIWPYFFDGEDYEAMRTESPVPVFSCWNGIVVFDANPVLPVHLRSNRTLSTDSHPLALSASHPAASDTSLLDPSPPVLRFRASAPGECYSSESFLFPYDLRRTFNLQRIFVNPRVVVGYDWRFYVYFKWLMRHPVIKWWIEKVHDGAWMQRAVMIIGDAKQVWQWDGVDCHPWW